MSEKKRVSINASLDTSGKKMFKLSIDEGLESKRRKSIKVAKDQPEDDDSNKDISRSAFMRRKRYNDR